MIVSRLALCGKTRLRIPIVAKRLRRGLQSGQRRLRQKILRVSKAPRSSQAATNEHSCSQLSGLVHYCDSLLCTLLSHTHTVFCQRHAVIKGSHVLVLTTVITTFYGEKRVTSAALRQSRQIDQARWSCKPSCKRVVPTCEPSQTRVSIPVFASTPGIRLAESTSGELLLDIGLSTVFGACDSTRTGVPCVGRKESYPQLVPRAVTVSVFGKPQRTVCSAHDSSRPQEGCLSSPGQPVPGDSAAGQRASEGRRAGAR
jgi:hypothetical protein